MQFGNGPKEGLKYGFEYERIGGPSPFYRITRSQMRSLEEELQAHSKDLGVRFVVDMGVLDGCESQAPSLAATRLRPGQRGQGQALTWCGPPDAPWEDCDPQRHNVDGPIPRLLDQGVTEIIAIDMTVGGARVFQDTRRDSDTAPETGRRGSRRRRTRFPSLVE